AVATYETGAAAATRTAQDTSANPEIVERLKSLGYIGGTSPAPGLHSPQGEKNLAAMHFEAGRYAQSAEAYTRLVERDPRDASLRTSLAGALGALGRYPEAMKQLEMAIKLDPLDVEAYHNKA